jgi:hypothetical protein
MPRLHSHLLCRTSLVLTMLMLALPLQAGSPVGPGAITLPPIVAKYDEHCLDRIDKKDDKLAARQSRECRKPRGSRNGLPTAHGAEPVSPPATAKPAQVQ